MDNLAKLFSHPEVSPRLFLHTGMKYYVFHRVVVIIKQAHILKAFSTIPDTWQILKIHLLLLALATNASLSVNAV